MKFCGQCGRQIPDDAFACPYCGAIQGSAPARTPAKPSFGESLKAFVQKNKAIVIAAAGALAAAIVLLLALAIFGSSYKTPVKDYIKQQNVSSLDVEKDFVNMYGGLGKSHLKKIYKILSSSENFEDYCDGLQDEFMTYRDDLEDAYGSNYKYSVKFLDRDPMTNSSLRTYKEDWFKVCGKRLMSEGDAILDMNSDDLRELADRMGLEKDDLRTLGKELKELGKDIKNANVKKGYEVDVTIFVKGIDDRDDYDVTFSVVKADGKWVNPIRIDQYTLLNYLYGIGY